MWRQAQAIVERKIQVPLSLTTRVLEPVMMSLTVREKNGEAAAKTTSFKLGNEWFQTIAVCAVSTTRVQPFNHANLLDDGWMDGWIDVDVDVDVDWIPPLPFNCEQ
jgi:hypothetical protein